MAAPIRPNFQPQATTTPNVQRPDATRSAAQRAFFEAALGKAAPQAIQTQTIAQPAATPRTASPAVAQAAYVQKIPTTLPTEAPTRYLRPGSILDIKV
ncbi:hypothetical protein [Phenylobacterium aquaticum]|uniref:hypothetical protein n=1 Tax=Phenylobacterium aquaticum TaxID=1763816 RepID=UPI0026F2ED57|nr:hypothetical protein [Phenylobacterium aquaticum]